MLKLEFFSQNVIEEYEKEITDKIKDRNNGSDDIVFLSYGNDTVEKNYSISIHELLTYMREQILEIDGIKLYMCICSAQKYKNLSYAELLHTLSQKFPGQIHKCCCKNDNYKYLINEAASVIKNEFANLDADYADHYFDISKINSVADLNELLDKMFHDLKNQLIDSVSQKPIISYSLISGKMRHKLMVSSGTRTCPYCNRNYTTRYGIQGNKSTADLDHFYQKDQYPLFALSLFNFVPSCPVCNSRMKNTHPADDALYPYEEGFDDDVHFELEYKPNMPSKNILHLWQAILNTDHDNFKIKIVIDTLTDSDRRKRIENSIALFHIDEVYEDHKQEALETALRTRIFCEGSYKKFCHKLFDKFEEKGMKYSSLSDLEQFLFRDGFDREWLMFGIHMNDEKRRFDRPLSKMIYDIYNSEKH